MPHLAIFVLAGLSWRNRAELSVAKDDGEDLFARCGLRQPWSKKYDMMVRLLEQVDLACDTLAFPVAAADDAAPASK